MEHWLYVKHLPPRPAPLQKKSPAPQKPAQKVGSSVVLLHLTCEGREVLIYWCRPSPLLYTRSAVYHLLPCCRSPWRGCVMTYGGTDP